MSPVPSPARLRLFARYALAGFSCVFLPSILRASCFPRQLGSSSQRVLTRRRRSYCSYCVSAQSLSSFCFLVSLRIR